MELEKFLNEVNTLEKSIQECVDYCVSFLKTKKVVEDIKVKDDTIFFRVRDTVFQIYVEGHDVVHFGIKYVDGLERLNDDFWSDKDRLEDYLYIDEFYEEFIVENRFAYITEICRTLNEMIDTYGSDNIKNIIKNYLN